MQNRRQQNGPTSTAMPHVKPVLHGDSGTRSQSSALEHSAVHRPLVPLGYVEPGGRSLTSGTRKHVRVTQSSDGEATTISLGSGKLLQVSPIGHCELIMHDIIVCTEQVPCVPRSQIRPTGFPPHAAAALTRHMTTT